LINFLGDKFFYNFKKKMKNLFYRQYYLIIFPKNIFLIKLNKAIFTKLFIKKNYVIKDQLGWMTARR